MAGTFQIVHLVDTLKSRWALSLRAMSSLITSNVAALAATATDTTTPTASGLPSPQAILLDFGGVIFETSKSPDGRDRLAVLHATLLAGRILDFACGP